MTRSDGLYDETDPSIAEYLRTRPRSQRIREAIRPLTLKVLYVIRFIAIVASTLYGAYAFWYAFTTGDLLGGVVRFVASFVVYAIFAFIWAIPVAALSR